MPEKTGPSGRIDNVCYHDAADYPGIGFELQAPAIHAEYGSDFLFCISKYSIFETVQTIPFSKYFRLWRMEKRGFPEESVPGSGAADVIRKKAMNGSSRAGRSGGFFYVFGNCE